jgi:hypothetical protein
MKKFAILALAAVMVIALTVPASALENEFGGYWRTRFFQQGHFDGESDDAGSQRRVDTRTRLFYTAKINDNLKFVNKFEMNTVWGSQDNEVFVQQDTDFDGLPDVDDNGDDEWSTISTSSTYGDVGADGISIAVKNSYADFNVGPVNFTVGVQPYLLLRGLVIDNDASGVIFRYKALDNLVIAGSWLKGYEGGAGGGNNEDLDTYTLTTAVWFSENVSIKPSITWAHASEIDPEYGLGLFGVDETTLPGPGEFPPFPINRTTATFGDADIYVLSMDFDASFDNWGVWASGGYQMGTANDVSLNPAFVPVDDWDFNGYVVALGGNVMLGMADLHTEFIYASGDDNAGDDDIDQWFGVSESYYWSEIMGLGIFDNDAPTNCPGDQVSNLMAFNIGATFKPMDKLSVTTDLWYAKLNEDALFRNAALVVVDEEDELGVELDVKVTYELVEGLNLDLVGAYLWAGDAVSDDGSNDENPYEFGARLSLSF